jgi:hypothetical protein
MDSSFISLFIFIIITILYYYFLKPKMNITIFDDTTGKEYSTYSSKTYISLLVYFLIILLSQIGINTSIIINKCGGSITENFGAAFLMTLIPWVFIFGGIIAILIMFPGFKSAFSNVVGYYVVAGSANNILSELLNNNEINKTIDENIAGELNQNQNLKAAADAIIKMIGNMSILINQIVPGNFSEYWSMLTPLMKPQYQVNPGQIKQDLLNVVVLRDNIGEALWYTYTAILLISITQYNIATRGCSKNIATMQEMKNQYLDAQTQVKEQNDKAKSVTYTF